MSFNLFTIGKKTSKDLGATGKQQHCAWCNNPVYYHLILERTWLTYFFVPIFSYSSEYRIECPICLCGVILQGHEIKAAKRGELSLKVDTMNLSDET